MSQRTASRRLLVGGTSAALLLGAVGAVPLLSAASAACPPTYTDPAGDAILVANGAAVPGGPDLGNDPDMDILDVTHSVDAGVFSSVVHVKGLTDFGPVVSYTDDFITHFTVNGKAVDVKGRRSHSMNPVASAETDIGTLTVAGTATTVPVKVVIDLKVSTVTTQVAVPAFETALGGPLGGKPFTLMTATTNQVFNVSDVNSPGIAKTMDTATAPASASYVFGTSCSGGGAPAPTGTPAPTGSPSPTPSPGGGGTTLFDQPRKGCVQFKDPAGDADPSGTGQDNEKSLDVTQVNLKSPADGSLQVFVKVADLAGGLNLPAEGGLYDVTFTVAGKAVEVAVDDSGKITSAMVAGKASTDLKPTAKLDTKNSNVVFTFAKDGLEKAIGGSLAAGTPVTGTTIATSATTPVRAFPADTAKGTTDAEKTYAYGDNACFLPPAGSFSVDADPRGEYSDVTELFATLNDADSSPVPGVPVTASLAGGKPVTAVTDGDGVADFKLKIAVPAGRRTIAIAFAGNSDVGATKGSVPFTVVAEKVLMRAVGIRGGAQATLLDDSKQPVAGQPVVFTIGSTRKVVKTNSKGVAVLGGLAKGTAVKVAYAGKRGYYTATPTYTVKAL